MNFDFSDDQRLLQDAVRTMLAETSTSQAVREVLDFYNMAAAFGDPLLIPAGKA